MGDQRACLAHSYEHIMMLSNVDHTSIDFTSVISSAHKLSVNIVDSKCSGVFYNCILVLNIQGGTTPNTLSCERSSKNLHS